MVTKKRKRKKPNQNAKEVILEAAENWPTAFIPRQSIPKFTGGLYTAGYVANCDSNGTGPEGGFYIGRQKCYPVLKFCEWLISKLG